MNSADLLAASDRCPRAGFYSRDYEFSRLHPTEILRRAVDVGLMSEENDPGQAAGDQVMTFAAERGLDIEGSGVYPIALHCAALADLVTTLLRQDAIWARPADKTTGSLTWVSSAYLASSGVRLHRVLLVDRWSDERAKAERLGWRCLGEQSVYELPMTIHVVVLGQRRNQKYVGPFSQGYLHPRSRTLRIRKKTGEGFSKEWARCWREEQDTISRDKWIEAMQTDGVMEDSIFTLDCDPPPAKLASEIRQLAERKLRQIQETTKTPDMNPSSCWWPVPCQFAGCCWESRQEPSQRNGFVSSIDSTLLSSSQGIPRELGRSREPQAAESNICRVETRSDESSDGEELSMALDVIKPNNHLLLKFRVPPRKLHIEYEVEASSPVTTFIVDDEGVKEYNSKGSDVHSYYGGFSHRRVHKEKVDFPSDYDGGPCYLIIQNDSDKNPVAVRYEVYA